MINGVFFENAKVDEIFDFGEFFQGWGSRQKKI